MVSPAYTSISAGWSVASRQFEVAASQARAQHWGELWHDSRIVVLCAVAAASIAFLDPPRRLRIYIYDPFESNAVRLFMRLVYGLVVVVICAYALLLVQIVYRVPFDQQTASEIARRPWLPPEELVVEGQGTLVGYTLATTDKWHVVLNDTDRTISYVGSASVRTRRVCRTTALQLMPRRPLVHLAGAQLVRLPPCAPVDERRPGESVPPAPPRDSSLNHV
jgi:hypothetical protein